METGEGMEGEGMKGEFRAFMTQQKKMNAMLMAILRATSNANPGTTIVLLLLCFTSCFL